MRPQSRSTRRLPPSPNLLGAGRAAAAGPGAAAAGLARRAPLGIRRETAA